MVVLDPDGFDRKDPHLYDRLFTRDEFEVGLGKSTTTPMDDTTREAARRTQTTYTVGEDGVVISATTREVKDPDPEFPTPPGKYPIPTRWRDPETGKAVDYIPATDLEPVFWEMVDAYPELQHIRSHGITVDLWWAKKGGTSGGALIYGKHVIKRGLDRIYAKVDVILTLSADVLTLIGGEERQVKASLYHLARHIGVKEGKITTLPHDFVGTADEVRRFGPWTEGLDKMIEAADSGGWVQATMDLDGSPLKQDDEQPDDRDEADEDSGEDTIGVRVPPKKPSHSNGDIRVLYTAAHRVALEDQIRSAHGGKWPKNGVTMECPTDQSAGVTLTQPTDLPEDDLDCPCGRDTCWLVLYTEPR